MNAPKTAEEHIDALMAIHPKGYDLSLDRICALLEKLGNPQDKVPPVIHVAGTNGKGSTIAFCRSLLEAAGLAVHVHTSPHLVNWHERYRIGQKGVAGKLVSDPMLADAINRVAEVNGGQPITVFEVMTAVGFILFSEQPADVCLIEVGLGGRFDSTNVMTAPALSIITPVSIDHEAYLGGTLAKIAFEKAGIIKRRTPVIVGSQEAEALEVIEQQASRQLSPIIVSGQDFSASRENGRMVYQDETCLIDLDPPRLPGAHQISNAATAIAACKHFCADHNHELTETMVDDGLQNVYWPGRMQRLHEGALFKIAPEGSDIWLDGGHNPGAAQVVAAFIRERQATNPRALFLICGMLNTKDPGGYFAPLSGLVDKVITVPVTSSDAGIDPVILAEVAANCGLPATAAKSLSCAFDDINGNPSPLILLSGSLYIVGEALAENGTPPV